MPKPLPKLDTTYTEESPDPRDPLAVALDRHLEDVRLWTEWVTNGDPSTAGWIDYTIWRTFEVWIGRKEALDIIDSILQSRLKLGFPYDQKAIILAQLIPESRLAPYAELLKPLLPPPPPAHPAPASVKAAEAEAAKKAEEAKKKEEDEIKKWETWCNAYGRTNRADWRAMPGNPAWTWWGWNEIGKEEWWKGRNE
ncbi:hypothetical protein I316_04308 [Kwoniella heveanensis BCC8398]|uniref:Uncharacterized protein n=1 Tax=Kwoniella heveanensis BCC8398 TaxID=1296120 RepID=A0A1B9GSB3_9TREE|nr:hypothetical protein I316_04308 [Kwoniella heveanensis BCC8398]